MPRIRLLGNSQDYHLIPLILLGYFPYAYRFPIPQLLGPGGALFLRCDFRKKNMITYGTRFSSEKIRKVNIPNKWTLPRSKYLSPGTKSNPGPNCHRRTSLCQRLDFRKFRSFFLTKKWELTFFWTISELGLIITIDTREHRETVEKIFWKSVSNLRRFLFCQ